MKIITKITDLLNKKRKEKDENLLKEYEKGKILQIDNDVDNKEFLKGK